jgi:hypothetical protein
MIGFTTVATVKEYEPAQLGDVLDRFKLGSTPLPETVRDGAHFGGWEDAVAAYHSVTPARGVPYRQAVYSTWSGAGAAAVPARNVEPLVVYSIGGVQINVWPPIRVGVVPSLIGITRATAEDWTNLCAISHRVLDGDTCNIL